MNCGNFDGCEVMEESNEDDDIAGLLRDLATGLDDRGDFDDSSSVLEPCVELLAIQKLVEENSKELYPNCKKYTQLRFLIRLLHLKLLGGLHVTDISSGPQMMRKGRGITKLPDIFSRTPDLPKIEIIVNEYGQPIRENVKRFTRAIGCIVRRKLRVGCSDWRLVDAEMKFEVWADIKVFHHILSHMLHHT